MRALFDDGTAHQEHEQGEGDGEDGEDEQAVKVSEGGGLLLARVVEGLKRHLMRGDGITGGGRLATETGPLGSTAAVTYAYDALGRSTGTSIADSGGANTSSVSYDALGRMDGATNPLGTFTYGFYGTTPRLESVSNNQNGLNTSFSYQTGSTQDYRLTDISNYSTGTTVLSKFDYTYTAVGDIMTKQE